jgi:CDP-glucose 4,6-dehydratase
MSDLARAFAGRRVLVTGHTGFKGTWLCLWLAELGAEVHGYALPPPTRPSLYGEARVREVLASETTADVRDAAALDAAVAKARPEVVFHLAAQAIVRRSYREPAATWATNVLGTVHVMEAVRQAGGVRACQVITSDKCYENPGQVCAFRETDPMGGHDPYSSSKGAAELAVAAWRRSFFPPARVAEHGVSLASARAGNVIGGGDWAEDRILPDCVRALANGEPVPVRNPQAVRPWQHVLEPLSGYLWLAAAQLEEPATFADGFNFGPLPTGNLTVGQVADLVVSFWGSGRWEHQPPPGEAAARDRLHEAAFLKLDITKATTLLDWTPVLTPREAITETVAWYRQRHREGTAFDARAACRRQIADYQQRQAAAGQPTESA